MTTKSENTGNRNSDIYFSKWIRRNLPDGWLNGDKNFNVSDIDFVLINDKTHKFCIIEVKLFPYDISDRQREVYDFIHIRLLEGNKCCFDGYRYLGRYFVQFDGEGAFWLNRKEITETELIEKLSFF